MGVGTDVGVGCRVDLFVGVETACGEIEEAGGAASVVFGDEVAYGFGKLGAFGPFESVGDVARDYACALFGFEGVVWVDTMLVFSEEGWIVDLAYVVIQCAGPDKLYVGCLLYTSPSPRDS